MRSDDAAVDSPLLASQHHYNHDTFRSLSYEERIQESRFIMNRLRSSGHDLLLTRPHEYKSENIVHDGIYVVGIA